MGMGALKKMIAEVKGEAGAFYELLILYFYALSTASPNPRDILKMASTPSAPIRDLSQIFRKVSEAVERWGYELNKALRYVLNKIRDRDVQSFLKRLSDSMTLSLDIREFMRVELERMMASLVDEFERRLDRVKKMIDAYSAILTSTAFLSVSMLLIASIYGINVNNLLLSTAIGIFIILTLMSLLIAHSLPPDPVLHEEGHCPEKLKLLKKASVLGIPASIAISVTLLTIFGAESDPIKAMSLPLLVSGVPLLVVGRIGLRWVNKSREIDRNLPSFMKSLGDAVEVSGSVKSACKLILMNDYGPMNKLLKKLKKRLEMGFSQRLALQTFGRETISKLSYSMSSIMADALHYGARGSIVGKAIHDYSLRKLENRKKRMQAAGMLWGIALPLQAAFSAISALISVLMKTMAAFINLTSSWLPLFAPIPEPYIHTFFLSITFATAYASAFSFYRIRGDSSFSFTYALGFLLAVSGVVYAFASMVSQSILRMAMNLTEEITSLLGEL